jgi:hypothetical protein
MTDGSQPWRPEFSNALKLLARVSAAMDRRGLPRPVLVGGGAVEFYSGSALMTGDIDVTSPVQPELEDELRKAGFVRPSGPGKLLRGWVHPELGFGLEVVADSPMNGAAEPARFLLVRPIDDHDFFRIISVEDLIADRVAQFASGAAREMLAQALVLFDLYADLDRDYLDARIRNETGGEHGIQILET